MRVKPYLQLVRLPNLFTAVADSLAGWWLVTGSFREPRHWLPLALASLATYAGGVVLNDVFDYQVDLKERPNRPLPSGRVGIRTAAWFGAGLVSLGPVLALLAGTRHGLVVAVVLTVCVLAYDAGLKRSALGPEVMGACRGLNLLLGMSDSPTLGGPSGWVAAVAYGAFVAGITWVSRSEVQAGPGPRASPGIAAGVIVQNLALLGLVAAAVHPEGFDPPVRGDAARAAAGLVALLTVAFVVNSRSIVALRAPTDAVVQGAVKTAILALVWLHVGLLLAVRGPAAALAVAWLWFPAVLAGRWVYST
jgi:4-hydroxybenzoate polyprenyltransferase